MPAMIFWHTVRASDSGSRRRIIVFTQRWKSVLGTLRHIGPRCVLQAADVAVARNRGVAGLGRRRRGRAHPHQAHGSSEQAERRVVACARRRHRAGTRRSRQRRGGKRARINIRSSNRAYRPNKGNGGTTVQHSLVAGVIQLSAVRSGASSFSATRRTGRAPASRPSSHAILCRGRQPGAKSGRADVGDAVARPHRSLPGAGRQVR